MTTPLQYAEFLPYDVRKTSHRVTAKTLGDKICCHEQGNHNSGTYQTLSVHEEIMDWERECATCKRRKAKQAEAHTQRF